MKLLDKLQDFAAEFEDKNYAKVAKTLRRKEIFLGEAIFYQTQRDLNRSQANVLDLKPN